jgi:putative FmdB family regulatory protein
MPVYEYKCTVCGKSHEEVRQIRHRDLTSPCPEPQCDGACERDVVASMSPHTDTGYQSPILSEALGVDPSQIADAQKRFPHHKFTPDGRMILESHQERSKVLKELGFRDWDSYK